MPQLDLASLFGRTNAASLLEQAPSREIMHSAALQECTLDRVRALRSPNTLFRAWDGVRGYASAWPPSSTTATHSSTSRSPLKSQQRSNLIALHKAGFVVAIHDSHRFIPELERACRDLEFQLGTPVDSITAQVFVSPVGGTVAAHYDDESSIALQLRGTKCWHFADNTFVAQPSCGYMIGDPIPTSLRQEAVRPVPRTASELSFRTRIASPGTALFLPAGVIHATEVIAHSPPHSLSVTFSIARRPLAARLATKVARHLERRIPELRASPLHHAHHLALTQPAERAAFELRRLARRLDTDSLFRNRAASYRFSSNLSDATLDSDNVMTFVDADGGSHRVALDPPCAAIVARYGVERHDGGTGSSGGVDARPRVTLAQAASELSSIDSADVKGAIRRLARSGVFERCHDGFSA